MRQRHSFARTTSENFLLASLGLATLVFVPLVGLSIWVGQLWPLDLQRAFGLTAAQATTAWGTLLLVYCVFAAIIPVWLLLQPRGYLGGVFLYVALAGGMLGLAFGGRTVEYPAWIGWTSARGETLFPMLFITIACGACSGFHALICSGTTSKQLARERDARAIGYGAMLLEGMVAVVSLCCVMMLAPAAPVLQGGVKPNLIYALGIGSFLNVLGIPHEWAVAFALMAFTTFVYDTLDVCTRLGRYILQELTGWRSAAGRWVATAATAGVPLYFLWQRPRGADGAPVQLWRTFWALFGASNQLLAALTLLGVTVWLWRTRRAAWVLFIVGLPTLFMYAMSTWALIAMTAPAFVRDGRWRLPHEPVPWVGAVLLGLAAWMFVEALVVLGRSRSSPGAPLTCSARHPSRRG